MQPAIIVCNPQVMILLSSSALVKHIRLPDWCGVVQYASSKSVNRKAFRRDDVIASIYVPSSRSGNRPVLGWLVLQAA
jgi:hypothetical protein